VHIRPQDSKLAQCAVGSVDGDGDALNDVEAALPAFYCPFLATVVNAFRAGTCGARRGSAPFFSRVFLFLSRYSVLGVATSCLDLHGASLLSGERLLVVPHLRRAALWGARYGDIWARGCVARGLRAFLIARLPCFVPGIGSAGLPLFIFTRAPSSSYLAMARGALDIARAAFSLFRLSPTRCPGDGRGCWPGALFVTSRAQPLFLHLHGDIVILCLWMAFGVWCRIACSLISPLSPSSRHAAQVMDGRLPGCELHSRKDYDVVSLLCNNWWMYIRCGGGGNSRHGAIHVSCYTFDI
jgi:hypothetical protein